MEKEIIEQNIWWKDKGLISEDYDIFKWNEKRHKWIPSLLDKINLEGFALHILSGPRQAGKTTALKLLIKKLLESGRDPRSLFYFNCENLGDYKELTEVLNFYQEFRENNKIRDSIIMLDEITLPKEWYRAIKFFIDRGIFKNDVIILTGSSSMFVKREVELFPGRRGKGKDFILYPLSFREFIRVFDKEIVEKIPPLKRIDGIEKIAINALVFEKELNKYLENYMEYGGFPLSVAHMEKSKEEAKRVYLSWIKNSILKDDRNDIIARQIVKVVIETLQSDISWESISKRIEIKSPKTVAAYLDFLRSIFAVNILYNVDINEKKIRFGKNKKIHFRDPLLLDIFEEWCMINVNDKGSALAESLVVEHLERMFSGEVFFWKNGFEIDAIVLEKNKAYGFEVKWAQKSSAKSLSQLKKFIIVTKKDYSKSPCKIPLAVFLSIFDV